MTEDCTCHFSGDNESGNQRITALKAVSLIQIFELQYAEHLMTTIKRNIDMARIYDHLMCSETFLVIQKL